MQPQPNTTYKLILVIIGIVVFAMGVVLFCVPPALFPDPANGFQVLRSMQMGSAFNVMTAPDQSDISQNYTEFLTWWSPGQYLVPYFFKLTGHLSLGQSTAITVTLSEICGLTGLYYFFKKIGFSPLVASVSLLFIMCQLAFFVPQVYYNGGESLLFAFDGWFLFGCISFTRPGWKMVAFVLFSGWIGFFCKSSFLWIYAAGLFCLWINICIFRLSLIERIKKALWVGIPAVTSLLVILTTFISRGQSPASTSKGFKFAAEVLGFPLASPMLTNFSADDLLHGILINFSKPLFPHGWAVLIVLIMATLSVLLVITILRQINNEKYRVLVATFYLTSILFFGFAFFKQLNISYEARHFRIIGLLLAPGIITIVLKGKPAYRSLFLVVCIGLAVYSINYTIKGYSINNTLSARGTTGLAQPNIDQPALNTVMKLDQENKKAVFVFVSNEIGLEVNHNRIINLPPISDDLKIDMDDYRYEGHAGRLFIILPETYNGPKEKMIMKSFPGYKGFNLSILSSKFVLYSSK